MRSCKICGGAGCSNCFNTGIGPDDLDIEFEKPEESADDWVKAELDMDDEFDDGPNDPAEDEWHESQLDDEEFADEYDDDDLEHLWDEEDDEDLPALPDDEDEFFP